MSKGANMTVQQARFVKGLANGMLPQESAINAGYSAHSAHVQAYQLLRNPKIQRALDKAGLTDNTVAETIKKATMAGLGVKATNSDTLKGLELITRLRGYQDKAPDSITQNNTYINELRVMPDSDLKKEFDNLTRVIRELE